MFIEVCCFVVCGVLLLCELCIGRWLVWVFWDRFLYNLYDGIGLKYVMEGLSGCIVIC